MVVLLASIAVYEFNAVCEVSTPSYCGWSNCLRLLLLILMASLQCFQKFWQILFQPGMAFLASYAPVVLLLVLLMPFFLDDDF
jgi:hypothetical protein